MLPLQGVARLCTGAAYRLCKRSPGGAHLDVRAHAAEHQHTAAAAHQNLRPSAHGLHLCGSVPTGTHTTSCPVTDSKAQAWERSDRHHDLQAGACCALGSTCSWAYLSLIAKEVEQLPCSYQSPMLAAKDTENWFLQKLAVWATSYRCCSTAGLVRRALVRDTPVLYAAHHARRVCQYCVHGQVLIPWIVRCRHSLKPRLLIPIGLMLGFMAYNHLVDISQRMGYVEIASLAAGFLASKVGTMCEALSWQQSRHHHVLRLFSCRCIFLLSGAGLSGAGCKCMTSESDVHQTF